MISRSISRVICWVFRWIGRREIKQKSWHSSEGAVGDPAVVGAFGDPAVDGALGAVGVGGDPVCGGALGFGGEPDVEGVLGVGGGGT